MKGDNLGRYPEEISRRLIALGERRDINWLVYNPIEFARYFIYAHSTRDAVADAVIRTVPEAQSFVDVGGGTGTYAAALKKRGRRVTACEKSPIGRLASLVQGVRSRPFDLASDVKLPDADVAMCFEVAEHVPASLGDNLIAVLARYPLVLFTAAHPGQTGLGHINEQPMDYWLTRFASHGMTKDDARSEQIVTAFRDLEAPWWLVENAVVLERR